MEELKELRFNEKNILLHNHRIKGSILPEKATELNRNITVQGNTVIEGAVFANKLEIQQGKVYFEGAVYTQLELHINTDAAGEIEFKKTVGSTSSVISRANNAELSFHADINASVVTLYNAFVAGSIYADEIILKNCVVIGGVFGTQSIEISNSIVGTFNSPKVSLAEYVQILLPSAFSTEEIRTVADTKLYNLSLADLGSLYKGKEEAPESGKIEISLDVDKVKTVLKDEDSQKTLRSYTVVTKVLAADLLDFDKFQNHFLLTAASLGPQLLRTYDMGLDDKEQTIELTFAKIRAFFFDVLFGKIEVQEMTKTFDIKELFEEMKM